MEVSSELTQEKQGSGVTAQREELKDALGRLLNRELKRITCSNPNGSSDFIKLTVRPVEIRGRLLFQVEEFTDKQAFQKNLERDVAAGYVAGQIGTVYRNAEGFSGTASLHVMVSKKGKMTMKLRGISGEQAAGAPAKRPGSARIGAPGHEAAGRSRTGGGSGTGVPAAGGWENPCLSHNRSRNYILPEGEPVAFLVDLGVMTRDGRVVKGKYDKFRQINRFLEFIEDILPELSQERTNTILEFGCGKSYLTFARSYSLKEVRGYPIRVTGLDLKKDVIALCSRLGEKFGFKDLQFCHGDIAGYEGADQVDMVVSLHACDTATDFALAKAVKWGAKVILSVPCCQHELNRQLENELLGPVLQYGIIKERMAALLTDGIRARLLEEAGYRTQLLEFIDMEHTPKNIMIRAVRRGKRPAESGREALLRLMEELHVEPALLRLLEQSGVCPSRPRPAYASPPVS